MFETRDHIVEGRGEKEQLVAMPKTGSRHVQALAVVAGGGDMPGGFGDTKHGAERCPREQPADDHGYQQREHSGRQQQTRHRGHRVLEGRQRLGYLDCADNVAARVEMNRLGQQPHAGVARGNRDGDENGSIVGDRLETAGRHG